MLGMQEMILILVILLVVFGPSKLPKLARELGKAWQEFNKASSTAFEALNSADSPKNENEKKLLMDVATKLGVNSEGKTDKQLTEEILTKVINKETVST
jgi:sec-independent protein translocase protein TatA